MHIGIVVLQLAREISALSHSRLNAATHMVVQVAVSAGLDVTKTEDHPEIVDLAARMLAIDPYEGRARR